MSVDLGTFIPYTVYNLHSQKQNSAFYFHLACAFAHYFWIFSPNSGPGALKYGLLGHKKYGKSNKGSSFKIFRGLELLYQFLTCTIDCKVAHTINMN
jgi:hypothetical protein